MNRHLSAGRHAVSLLALAVLASVAPVYSAERPIELVPTLGVRGGAEIFTNPTGTPPAEADASVSFGLTFDHGLGPDTWLEVLFDRQTLEFSSDPAAFARTGFDVTVDYLQVGASYGPARAGVRPYVTAAAGLAHLGASNGAGGSSTGFSGSLGGGFQAPMGRRLAFRFEIRGYAIISDAEVAVACGSGCVARFGGSGWTQIAARVGLAIRL